MISCVVIKCSIESGFKLSFSVNCLSSVKSKISFSLELDKTIHSFGAKTFKFNVAFISGWSKHGSNLLQS